MLRPSSHSYKVIYLAALLLSFHYAFTIYINSTFLSQFFDSTEIARLYTLGSIITFILLSQSSSIIKRLKNYWFMIIILVLEITALFGLAASTNPTFIKLFFVLHQALPVLLAFNLDIFLESAISKEGKTGSIRALYLTTINTAFVLSPFIVGKLVGFYSYQFIYTISAFLVLFLLMLIVDKFRRYKAHKLKEVNFIDTLRKITHHPALMHILSLTFLLQCFYSIMVIYTPLYLHEYLHFNWSTIGVLFTIMLLPFVIFQAPLGKMFDRGTHTAREVLISGFLIMATATFLMFITHSANVIVWAVLLFVSRIGASFVEVANEYSFFKRVSDRDAGFISLYRLGSPSAYIIAPLIAGIIISFFSIEFIFLGIAGLMVIGSGLSYRALR